MIDVARAAGVSTMTVSNVINGRSARVSEATKQRVLATIAELGYQVNLAARQLRMGRTGLVGLAVPDFDFGYFSELADRLADRLAVHGLRLVMERTGGSRSAELDTLSAPRLSAYDGFVLSVVAGDRDDLEQLRIDTPVVLIGERAVPARFDHVLMDNVGGARAATALLLRTGARRIALLGGKTSRQQTMPALRTRGYRKAHEDAGVPIVPELIISSVHRTAGAYQAVRTLITDKIDFDAIFALTDTTAYGALRALAEAGRRVPDDVQVIGFDNLRASEYTVPSLTSVEPDNDAMADAICSLLVERIAQGATPVPARVIMPEAKIIERESTRSLAS